MTDEEWHDLLEDVASKIKHTNMTRTQQHKQLMRIAKAERLRIAEKFKGVAACCCSATFTGGDIKSQIMKA